MTNCLKVETIEDTFYLESVEMEIFQVKGISIGNHHMIIIPIEDIVSIKPYLETQNIGIISLN